jgi:hypothetical protein
MPKMRIGAPPVRPCRQAAISYMPTRKTDGSALEAPFRGIPERWGSRRKTPRTLTIAPHSEECALEDQDRDREIDDEPADVRQGCDEGC